MEYVHRETNVSKDEEAGSDVMQSLKQSDAVQCFGKRRSCQIDVVSVSDVLQKMMPLVSIMVLLILMCSIRFTLYQLHHQQELQAAAESATERAIELDGKLHRQGIALLAATTRTDSATRELKALRKELKDLHRDEAETEREKEATNSRLETLSQHQKETENKLNTELQRVAIGIRKQKHLRDEVLSLRKKHRVVSEALANETNAAAAVAEAAMQIQQELDQHRKANRADKERIEDLHMALKRETQLKEAQNQNFTGALRKELSEVEVLKKALGRASLLKQAAVQHLEQTLASQVALKQAIKKEREDKKMKQAELESSRAALAKQAALKEAADGHLKETFAQEVALKQAFEQEKKEKKMKEAEAQSLKQALANETKLTKAADTQAQELILQIKEQEEKIMATEARVDQLEDKLRESSLMEQKLRSEKDAVQTLVHQLATEKAAAQAAAKQFQKQEKGEEKEVRMLKQELHSQNETAELKIQGLSKEFAEQSLRLSELKGLKRNLRKAREDKLKEEMQFETDVQGRLRRILKEEVEASKKAKGESLLRKLLHRSNSQRKLARRSLLEDLLAREAESQRLLPSDEALLPTDEAKSSDLLSSDEADSDDPMI
eukprot:TRINITY_DN79538_c0_g1_i1.p1 TRINITY_DN79538_c0_g1~~TRINITY_DN79538_c0_g1_i1.p1  ORF type:complete len:609 (+),score=179.03 TRINITY_DN79538_c0_g1_i1:120-1946(+)